MTTLLTKRDIKHIEECHPRIQEIIYAAAKSYNCPRFRVIDGARTIEEQKENVRRGVSKTMRSRHIPAKNGWSHAVDIAPFINGKISWNWKDYHPLAKEIKKIAASFGTRLEWGGDWKSFKDGPHWQLPWKTFSGNTEAPDYVELTEDEREEERENHSPPKPIFNESIRLVLQHEGGYVNHPEDKGGPTNKGITLATFKRFIKPSGTIEDLKNLTTSQATIVYKQQYWDVCQCSELPNGIDHAVFDFAVNSGTMRARKFLQSVVGVEADGRIGPKTIQAAKSLNTVHVINALCDERLQYLERRPNAKTFLKGWTSRVERVRKEALSMTAARSVEVKASPPGRSLIEIIYQIIKRLLG